MVLHTAGTPAPPKHGDFGKPDNRKADRPRNQNPGRTSVRRLRDRPPIRATFRRAAWQKCERIPTLRRCNVPSDPVEQTKQVKAASDIVAVVGNYLAIHPAGKIFKALCPFHQDSRPSLDIDPARQRYKCWS